MEYRIALKKKVKTRPYSILIQKSKGSSAFDEQKVKNIAIEYRFFPTLVEPHFAPDHEMSNNNFEEAQFSTGPLFVPGKTLATDFQVDSRSSTVTH